MQYLQWTSISSVRTITDTTNWSDWTPPISARKVPPWNWNKTSKLTNHGNGNNNMFGFNSIDNAASVSTPVRSVWTTTDTTNCSDWSAAISVPRYPSKTFVKTSKFTNRGLGAYDMSGLNSIDNAMNWISNGGQIIRHYRSLITTTSFICPTVTQVLWRQKTSTRQPSNFLPKINLCNSVNRNKK